MPNCLAFPGYSNAMVSIFDVARAAGVSQTTVSHALNGKGRVGKKTKEHVEKVAKELGYHANTQAIGLRTGASRLIALQIASDMIEVTLPNSAYFTELLNGASQAAMESGWLVVVVPTLIDLDALEGSGISAGIVVDPTGAEPLLKYLNERDGVAVTTGRLPEAAKRDLSRLSLSHVDNDMRALTFSGLDHLLASGYKRPALLTMNSQKSYIDDIIAAYQSWCAASDLDAIVARASNLNEPHAARTAEQLLNQTPAPDAIFTTNEGAAHGVIKAAQRLGLNIPDDLGLISTMPTSRILHSLPSMTAINPNAFEIGRTAVRVLLRRLIDRAFPVESGPVPFSLRPGASTSRSMILRSSRKR